MSGGLSVNRQRRTAGRLRIGLALLATLVVLGIAPALTAAAASARLVDLGLAPGTVHPGDSVTLTITADREVSESRCGADLDGQPLPVAGCRWTYRTLSAATGSPTDGATPTVVTMIDVTVIVPSTTAPGAHDLVVRADKGIAQRTLQVTNPLVFTRTAATVPDLLGMKL